MAMTANTATGNTIVGVFSTAQSAQRAVMDLRSAGFSDDQVGVISRNSDGKVVSKGGDGETGENSAGGAATGAAAGAGLGALWGLGILAGVLPGIGPAIAGGTLGILLSSAAAGAAALGVAGALAGLGLSQEDAGYYENEFKSGRTLVTVKAGAKSAAAERIIAQHGGTTRQPQTAGV